MSKAPTSEFKSSVGVVMIRVPAGSFTMGSPESEDGHRVWEQQREVSFVNDFYLGKSPVTQDQYEAVTGTNPTDHEEIGDAPVDSVSWDQAKEYCQRLTELDREAGVLPDGWEYRLPTEAEWEYACRAGSSEPRHGQPQDVAWHHDNADEKPHAVGQQTPNPWGSMTCSAMSGNGVRTGSAWQIPVGPFAGGATSTVPASAVPPSAGAGIRTVADAIAAFDCSLQRPARST
jgi:formylglycine-generating enzyme required for sulfatase activity